MRPEAIGGTRLWKRFGATVANRDVSLSIGTGEIHAVIGENGAGKSTLMRALYGVDPPDEGEVRLHGEVIAHPSVEASLARGVGMVHQHFMLVPTLSVAENVMLGREVTRGPLLDITRVSREVAEIGERFGLTVDPRRAVGSLSVGEAQRVEILKVLWRGARVLILDEPTAVLTPAEVEQLFGVLRALQAGGGTVVLVTHKLDEVMELAERVTVLRRGEVVAELFVRDATAASMAQAMVGRSVMLTAGREGPRARPARNRLRLERVTTEDSGRRTLDGVDLVVGEGEILGIAGVEGNGQRELAASAVGLLPLSSGRVFVDDLDVTAVGVRQRQERGVAHIPEDRQRRGLALDFSIEENFCLGREPVYARFLRLDRRRLRRDAVRLIERWDIRPSDPREAARALSGGNQQKVVLGRELERQPTVLVCAQPTRGVDVGAIERIHAELLALRAGGVAVLLISAELDELMALADRIAVLSRGRIVGVVDNEPPRNPAIRARLGDLMLVGR